jgi:hypothetical protein
LICHYSHVCKKTKQKTNLNFVVTCSHVKMQLIKVDARSCERMLRCAKS